jgi:hypothetical protein
LAISLVHGEEPGEDSLAVDECGAYERGDEVLVLFSEGAELSYAQVLFVEAPAGVAGLAVRCRGVGVLDFDEPPAPACGMADVLRSTPSIPNP